MTFRSIAFVAAICAALPAISAQAQQTTRVRGVIQHVDGPVIGVKAADGTEVKVSLADNVTVFGVAKGSLADIKVGDFVGVGAMPQPDGSQKAIQVVIFPEAMRGTGEGFRPWDRPNSTMTNATVATAVAGIDGRELLVKYKDGEKKIVVTPESAILAYAAGERSELKPGAAIAINGAVRHPDGTLQAARVNVGRGGLVP